MQDDDLRPSSNIEDRRGFGGGGGFRVGGGGLGVGAIIGLGLLGWALGINPLVLIEGAHHWYRRIAVWRVRSIQIF